MADSQANIPPGFEGGNAERTFSRNRKGISSEDQPDIGIGIDIGMGGQATGTNGILILSGLKHRW